MTRHRPQKGKGRQRRRNWHKGQPIADAWDRIAHQLPAVDSGADPTTGQPGPLRRVGHQNRGDAA